jgi:hypothetical protein
MISCSADTDLRHEVELLLAKEKQAGSFLEVHALEDVTITLTSVGSLLGRQFGPYRIVSPIGAGGMTKLPDPVISRPSRGMAGSSSLFAVLPPPYTQCASRPGRTPDSSS